MAYIPGMNEPRETDGADGEGTSAACPASHKKYMESRFCIVRGFLMLLAGSILLFCCKIPMPGFMSQVLAVIGGVVILFGNGYILFGLLIHADSRSK